MRKKFINFLIGFALVYFFGQEWSLSIDCRIQGIVTDESGQPIPGVKITLFDPSRGLKDSTSTNEKGKFFKRGIIPSTYEIVFDREGYITEKKTLTLQADWTEEMRVVLRKSHSLDDENFAIGTRCFKKGNFEEAILYFQKIPESSPNHAAALYNMSLSHMKQGDNENAITCLEKSLEINPRMTLAYLALAECYTQKEKLDSALNAFLKAKELEPKNPRIHFNLGILFSRLDRIDEAMSEFEKAENLDPEFASTHYQLGLLNLRKGNSEKAKSHFEKFLKLEPDATEAQSVLKILEELSVKH